MPKNLPPRSTLHDNLGQWHGTLEHIHHALYVACRGQVGRQASPTAAIIDRQRVKSAEKGGTDRSARLRCRQKIKGKKRHLLVGTEGLMLHAIVHAADIQDRDAGGHAVRLVSLPEQALRPRPLPGQGPRLREVVTQAIGQLEVAIVKRCDVGRSVVLPKLGSTSAIGWQGLGEPLPQRARFPPPGIQPRHAEKTM